METHMRLMAKEEHWRMRTIHTTTKVGAYLTCWIPQLERTTTDNRTKLTNEDQIITTTPPPTTNTAITRVITH